jgi:hypothetical protein
LGGTQFDNKVGNLLMEGKAWNWENFSPTSEAFSGFRNQIGREFGIATKNNYRFEAHFIDRPPQLVIKWLEKKGYPYVIESEK